MLKKLTGLVTNNFGLKILSLVFAVIIWMVIVNVEDPEKSVSFSVSVDIVNTEYLTDIGKTYEVLDNTDTISFTVTGQRSIVENLSASDFKAVANMENIDDSMSMVPVVITATSYSSQLEITKRNSYLLLNVENVVSDTYDIEVVTEGTLASGCYVSSAAVSPETVSVSGPESVVGQIASAQVTLDVSGATQTISSTESIVFLDADGNEVSQDRLTLDEAEAGVVVTAKILMSKEVNLSFEVTGEPEDGYRYNGEMEAEVDSVTLIGNWDTLNAMDELSISSTQLSVAGATETVSAVIHLPDYLPDGISLASGEEEDVTVTIVIEAQTTIEVEMPVANITCTGLDNGLELSYNSDTATVRITGYEEDLDSINGERIYGTLDASDLESGTYNVTIQLEEEYGEKAEASVSVTIAETSASDESENSNGTGTESDSQIQENSSEE
ncbi:MAG: hypothetical protein LIO96_12935 [Lachnospiraceae bacterium]|nr:hypothetical protein [Lachnospiraceae bacterium]